MNERDRLITAMEDAITELSVRREDPGTSPQERAQIDARLAELEAQLAALGAADIAQAAQEGALDAGDHSFDEMRAVAGELERAVAQGGEASTLLALVERGVRALRG